MAEQEEKVQEEDATKSETGMDQGTQSDDETVKAEPQPEEDPTAAQVDQTLQSSDTESTEEGTISSDPGSPAEDSPEGTLSSDSGAYGIDASEETTDETLTETSGEFAEVVAGRATTTDGDDEAEVVEPETAPVTETEPVADKVAAPEEHAADYKPDPVAVDDGFTSKTKEEPADVRSTEDQETVSTSPPEVTIGVSAAETLPDNTVRQPATSAFLDDVQPQVPLEVVDDDSIKNSDRVEKPVVENDAGPGNVSTLTGIGSSPAGSEALDVLNVAEGDADGTEPTMATPDFVSSGDADGTEPTRTTPDLLFRGDAGSKDDGPIGDEKPGSSTTSDSSLEFKSDAEDNKGQDDAEPAAMPIVQPVVAATAELTDQDLFVDNNVVIREPGTDTFGETDSLADAAYGVGLREVGKSGSELDPADIPKEPASPVAEPVSARDTAEAFREDAKDQVMQGNAPDAFPEAHDPVADSNAAREGGPANSFGQADASAPMPPLAGPALGIEDVRQENTSIADSLGQEDGSAPVFDNTGVQSGGVTSGTERSGAKWWLVESDDGAKHKATLWPDGSITEESVSADGSTWTTTERDSKHQVIEKRKVENKSNDDGTTTSITTTTTTNDDGSTTTTTTTTTSYPDGSTASSTVTTTTNPTDNDDKPGSPDNDYMVDEERLAAMHESEAAWQQAIRESSNINPVRTDQGAAEGGGDPPPGVDDPPEDEAPRSADDLPDDSPSTIGASGGNIDWGPDAVEQNDATASDPRVSEERGAQSGYGTAEANPVDAEISFVPDPAALKESLEEIQQAVSGVVPDDVIEFFLPGADESGPVAASQDSTSGVVSPQVFSRFGIPNALESVLPGSLFVSDDEEDQEPTDSDDDM
jgi:hypothetical protein